MGVAPLQFLPGQGIGALGLTGREVIDITGLTRGDASEVTVTATPPDGAAKQFNVRLRIDTPKEREYYRHGGILQYVLRQLASAGVDQTVRIWNPFTGKESLCFKGHDNPIMQVAWSPDGARVASSCGGGDATKQLAKSIRLFVRRSK